MDIKFACAECGATLKVNTSLAGSAIRCPRCGKRTAVPGEGNASTGPVQAAAEKAPAPSEPRAAPANAGADRAAVSRAREPQGKDRQALEQEIAKKYEAEIAKCRRIIADLEARLEAETQGNLPESARLDLAAGGEAGRDDVALYTLLAGIRKSAFGRRLRLVILFHAVVVVLIIIGGAITEAKTRAAKAAAAIALTNNVPAITSVVARATASNLTEQAVLTQQETRTEAPVAAGAAEPAAKGAAMPAPGEAEKAKPAVPAAEPSHEKTDVPQATEIKLDGDQ